MTIFVGKSGSYRCSYTKSPSALIRGLRGVPLPDSPVSAAHWNMGVGVGVINMIEMGTGVLEALLYTAVPNLFGTRDQFCKRQLSHGRGMEGASG